MNASPSTIQRLGAIEGQPGALRIALAALGAALFAAGWLLMLATGAPTARADDGQRGASPSKSIQLLRADDFAGSKTRVRDGAFATETLDAFDSKLARATGL